MKSYQQSVSFAVFTSAVVLTTFFIAVCQSISDDAKLPGPDIRAASMGARSAPGLMQARELANQMKRNWNSMRGKRENGAWMQAAALANGLNDESYSPYRMMRQMRLK
ncbi:uncharacterized protein LOC142351533 [Convolutriloba macropyga]|uniref:uncharacterized protein LOC142351533 n=1 Tax=Convolutriloba macropyga TaxID=536237 RepID=UPI003F51F572